MGWNQIGIRGGQCIAEGMKYNSSIKELALPWAALGDKGATSIGSILDSNTSLTKLDLSGNSVGGSTCMVLWKTIKGKQLKELIIRDNKIGNYGARQLMQIVKSGGRLVDVKRINQGSEVYRM